MGKKLRPASRWVPLRNSHREIYFFRKENFEAWEMSGRRFPETFPEDSPENFPENFPEECPGETSQRISRKTLLLGSYLDHSWEDRRFPEETFLIDGQLPGPFLRGQKISGRDFPNVTRTIPEKTEDFRKKLS